MGTSNSKFSNTILIPTDFSEVCENAIKHGAEIARFFSFKVVVLHVINKETSNYLKSEGLQESDLETKLAKILNDIFECCDVKGEYLIKNGNVFTEVENVANELNPNFLILGTHGKVGFQRLTGSYALKVISSVNSPTIVVQKRAFHNGYKNIVFPITTSTEDRQKVNWVILMSKMFGAKVHLFPRYETEEFHKRKIMAVTKQIKNIFDEHNVEYIDKVSPTRGNFAKQVVEYAVENDGDLITTMTNSESSLPMLDTWVEQLIYNTSQIPVLCVNPVQVKTTSWR